MPYEMLFTFLIPWGGRLSTLVKSVHEHFDLFSFFFFLGGVTD